jgi:hypothetical protein
MYVPQPKAQLVVRAPVAPSVSKPFVYGRLVLVQNHFRPGFSLERPGGVLMPCKHGRPVTGDFLLFIIAAVTKNEKI